MRFFDYAYFRIYSWYLRNFGKADGPAWTAVLVLVFLLETNLVTLVWLYEGLFEKNQFTDLILKRKITITCYLAGLLFGYFAWMKESSLTRIVEKYSTESTIERKWRTIYFRSYVIFSIVMPVYVTVYFLPD